MFGNYEQFKHFNTNVLISIKIKSNTNYKNFKPNQLNLK